MADEETAAMHPEFGRWYGAVSLGEDREKTSRRWAGVSALVAGATRVDIESMIRVAFRIKQEVSVEALARIRKPFKDADDLFEMHGNDRELEVLSGAALAVLFAKGGDDAATAALAATTAALGGARQFDLPMDLTTLAEQTIAKIAEAHRKRPDLARHTSAESTKLDFDKSMAKIAEVPSWDGVKAAFALAAESAASAIGKVARANTRAIDAANTFITIQDEELQMLWWIFGEHSSDLECAFSAIPAEAQALILGKELADATQFLPGPISAKPLLSRAGLKDRKKITIPAAVNQCETKWLTSLVTDSSSSLVSQPIHFAIRRKLETGDKTSWVAGWAATAGVDAVHAISPLTLGTLFYRERLLALFSKE
jgi:GTPase-associated system-like protein